jgi:hypothetical protein
MSDIVASAVQSEMVLPSQRQWRRMTPRRRAHRIKPDRRRALELLAASRNGVTEAILIAHGFTIDFQVELIRAGLATAKVERVVAAGCTIEVARVRITEAGRRTLAG